MTSSGELEAFGQPPNATSGLEHSRARNGTNACTQQPKPGNTFPASYRIKKREDFRAVFRRGKTAVDNMLVLHTLANPDCSCTRLGLSIPKKTGSAPERNLWKRLIREAFRQNYQSLPPGLLLIARPRKGAEPNFARIERSLVRLARKSIMANR